MPAAVAAHELRCCPRCGAGFVCRANAPARCACQDVTVSECAREYMARHFEGECLCLRCLREIAARPDYAFEERGGR